MPFIVLSNTIMVMFYRESGNEKQSRPGFRDPLMPISFRVAKWIDSKK